MMKAVFQTTYGSPEQLVPEEVSIPSPKKGEVRIKVHAVSLNGSDAEFLVGSPGYVRMWGLFKPRRRILGSDISGVVDAVGPSVSIFKEGDEVFGDVLESKGGLAEYVCAPADKLVPKPPQVSFEDAAAIPQGGTVALQGLRTKEGTPIASGTKLLINGAGGAAGSFAIQLAKLYGAHITAVDNGNKSDFLKQLGADCVIDYTQEDYTKGKDKYDLILDLVGYRSMFDCRRALSKNGQYLIVGGAFARIFQAHFYGLWVQLMSDQKMGVLMHKQNETDLRHMIDLHVNKNVSPIIDKVYPLDQTKEAFTRMIQGKALGKIIVVP